MEIAIFTAILIGLTELVKKTFGVTSRYVPLVALILSFVILGGYVLLSGDAITWQLVETCIITALTSVGLYSGVKNTLK